MNKFLGIVVAICVVIQAIDAYRVRCTNTQSRNSVTCSGGSYRAVTCTTVRAGGKGPAPPGTYMISGHYIHSDYGYDWHQLYPKSKTSSTYYDYKYINPETRRSLIAFHAGTISRGCITVRPACYARMRPMLKRATKSFRNVWSGSRWNRKYTIGVMTVV